MQSVNEYYTYRLFQNEKLTFRKSSNELLASQKIEDNDRTKKRQTKTKQKAGRKKGLGVVHLEDSYELREEGSSGVFF